MNININIFILFNFNFNFITVYYIAMESALMMVVHGAVIGAVLYLIMRFGLKTGEVVAQTRAVLVGLLAALYMLLFGHNLPVRLNKNL
jgi:hypothetical protein